MKRFAFILTLVASGLGTSLAFAGTQSGPSPATTNPTVVIDNNAAKSEKENTANNRPAKQTKKRAQRDSKQTETSRPLTTEEQEWERTVYNP